MQGLGSVVDRDVPDPVLVAVDEPFLERVPLELLQYRRALFLVHPLDRERRSRHPVESLAAGDVMGPDNQVPDGRDPLHLLVGDEGIRDRLVSLPAAGAVEVPGVASFETALQVLRKGVVRALQVRELRLAAGCGGPDREEHRRTRRNHLVGLVGMPERGAVADRLVVLPFTAVVADRHHLGIARHAQVVEHVRNRLAPPAPEREVLVLGHVLVANDEQAMFVHGVGEGLEHFVVETLGDVDPDCLGAEIRTSERTNRKHVPFLLLRGSGRR